jgi:hypothetical protein
MQELYSCLGDVTEAETKLRQQGNDKDLKTSFIGYDSCVQRIIAELENVVGLQDKIVSTGGLLGGLLSVSERNSIRDEVVKAKNIFNLHVRDDNASNDLRCIFDPMLFQNLVIAITTACPTITNILEQLVLTSNTGRNVIKTETMKMKAAVHLLASLLDIRDQHARNDIPILFGLLCICYGAGPAVIRVLQRLGLTESFPTLYVNHSTVMY